MSIRVRPVLSIVAIAMGLSQHVAATAWLEETFDTYDLGPLEGQGDWTGSGQGVLVVSTNSLTGNAAFCDADRLPIPNPAPPLGPLQRPVNVPDAGRHIVSFAVRVDARTTPFVGWQASLGLGNDEIPAIDLMILPETAVMTIRNNVSWGVPPSMTWDLGTVPGGQPDLTTGTYHVFEVELDFGRAGDIMDDIVCEVRLDGQSVPGLRGAAIGLTKPMDQLRLENGWAEEIARPDGVFFDSIMGRPAPSTAWLDETFDNYAVGPLLGQGAWTGVKSWISVVSTNSLAGNAAYCDADDPPIAGPYSTDVHRAVAVPREGRHLFSFAVRVDARTSPSVGWQASLDLGNDETPAIDLMILPETAVMTIRNNVSRSVPPSMTWDLGTVPGGWPDLTTGTYHVFEVDLDFGRVGDIKDDIVRDVRLDGQSVPGLRGAAIGLTKPMDRLRLENGWAAEIARPDAVFFDSIIGRPTPSTAWLEETFDDYAPGPLFGQGRWTGYTSRVAVVSTNSLTGNAACCDADDLPESFAPTHVFRPVNMPDSGMHLLSFAVRVETPTEPSYPQAALALGTSQTQAIALTITPGTAVLTIYNDFLSCGGHVVWDLGDVPGGHADLTTGTYHIFELDLDFGRPGYPLDDVVRAVRMDGTSYDFGCGGFGLRTPIDTLFLINGSAIEGSKPDAVFFDNIIGRAAATAARHWRLY